MYIVHTNKRIYLKDVNKIFDNDPVIIVELVLPQFQTLVGSDLVDSFLVCEDKTHHVICQVPSCYNIMRDKSLVEVKFQAGAAPHRKSNGCQMDDCKR